MLPQPRREQLILARVGVGLRFTHLPGEVAGLEVGEGHIAVTVRLFRKDSELEDIQGAAHSSRSRSIRANHNAL